MKIGIKSSTTIQCVIKEDNLAFVVLAKVICMKMLLIASLGLSRQGILTRSIWYDTKRRNRTASKIIYTRCI